MAKTTKKKTEIAEEVKAPAVETPATEEAPEVQTQKEAPVKKEGPSSTYIYISATLGEHQEAFKAQLGTLLATAGIKSEEAPSVDGYNYAISATVGSVLAIDYWTIKIGKLLRASRISNSKVVVEHV